MKELDCLHRQEKEEVSLEVNMEAAVQEINGDAEVEDLLDEVVPLLAGPVVLLLPHEEDMGAVVLVTAMVPTSELPNRLNTSVGSVQKHILIISVLSCQLELLKKPEMF